MYDTRNANAVVTHLTPYPTHLTHLTHPTERWPRMTAACRPPRGSRTTTPTSGRRSEPYPEKTLLDYLKALAAEHGDKPALLFKGATVSYARLEAESDAFGAALAAMGVRKGDRVALVLPNCPQFLIAEFGVWKAGGIVVALNPTYSERELEQALDSTRSSLVVVLTPFYERVKRVQGRTGVRHVIATSIKEYLPTPLRLLFTLLKEKKEGHRITPQPGDPWMGAMLRSHRGQRPSVDVSPDDRAVILSSGGTTGTPKGVVGLHRHYVAAGPAAVRVDEVGQDSRGWTTSCCRCRSSTCTRTSACSRWRSWGPTRCRSFPTRATSTTCSRRSNA